MTEIMDGTTIGAIFTTAVAAHGDRSFFAVPANEGRGYLGAGFEISYRDAGKRVEELAAIYREAGYGLGHRVATLLENRPEYVIHKLALNSIGACCVPINPEYRAGEIAYLIEHSEPELVIVLPTRREQLLSAISPSPHRPNVAVSDECASRLPKTLRPAQRGVVGPELRPASSTRLVPPDGRRDASSHMAMRSLQVPGMRRLAPWQRCELGRIASLIHCRSIT